MTHAAATLPPTPTPEFVTGRMSGLANEVSTSDATGTMIGEMSGAETDVVFATALSCDGAGEAEDETVLALLVVSTDVEAVSIADGVTLSSTFGEGTSAGCVGCGKSGV